MALAVIHVQLVIAVQMTLEGGITDLFCLFDNSSVMFGLPAAGKEGRKPVGPEMMPFSTLRAGYYRPADHRLSRGATSKIVPLSARTASVRRPAGEDLSAVVGVNRTTGVVVDPYP